MKVYPLLIGELEGTENDVFYKGNADRKVPFHCYSYYIEGASKKIIIDTGFGDPVFCQKNIGADEGFVLQIPTGLNWSDHFKRLKIKPESNELIILTHCHWDHIGGLSFFPNATILVQREELGWIFAPPEWLQRSYGPRIFGKPLIEARDRIIALDGDTVIEKGIRTKLIGGHSPGSQIVEIESKNRRVILTGGLVMKYANIEMQIPTGAYHNVEITDRYLKDLIALVTEDPRIVVLPVHDQKVWEMYQTGIALD